MVDGIAGGTRSSIALMAEVVEACPVPAKRPSCHTAVSRKPWMRWRGMTTRASGSTNHGPAIVGRTLGFPAKIHVGPSRHCELIRAGRSGFKKTSTAELRTMTGGVTRRKDVRDQSCGGDFLTPSKTARRTASQRDGSQILARAMRAPLRPAPDLWSRRRRCPAKVSKSHCRGQVLASASDDAIDRT